MRDSFKGWEAGEETRNASLKELESLTKLSCLEIEMEDVNLAVVEVELPPHISNFFVEIGKRLIDYRHHYRKVVSLDLPEYIGLGNWIRKLVRVSEIIELAGDGISSILEYLLASTNLKRLGIRKCSTIRALVDYSTSTSTSTFTFFPFLECLTLVDLRNLEKICDGHIPTGSDFLWYLNYLRLESLPRLLQLWSISPNQILSLPNLSTLEIKKCYNLENLFQLSMANLQPDALHVDMLVEDGRKRSQLAFPMLKNLKLYSLSNLTILYQGAESIEFPQLISMEIVNLPKLKNLVHQDNSGPHDKDSLHFFCNSKVAFGSLRELSIMRLDDNIRSLWCRRISVVHNELFRQIEKLYIYRCRGIRSLFASPSIFVNLSNLKQLNIRNCEEMVQVIGDVVEEEPALDNENIITAPNYINSMAKTSSYSDHRNKQCSSKQEFPHHHNNGYCKFPNLEMLTLFSLSKLERFVGRWNCCGNGDCGTVEFPSLIYLNIYGCGRMERFTLPGISLCTPNLKYIEIDKDDAILTKDVNGEIEKYYIENRIGGEVQLGRLMIESILVSGDSDFVIGKDGVKIHVSHLVGKTILLFFGQLLSQRCRDFLPKLIEVYMEINANGFTTEEGVEVIFISTDKEEASYDEFFSRMPWLAIPYGDERIYSLIRLFKIPRVPNVVAIGPTGETLSTQAEYIIWGYGARAYPFTEERIKEIKEENVKMVEGWPPQLMIDQLHPHELLLTNRSAVCDGCDKSEGVWFYYCEKCDFDLHKECATIIH